MTIIEIPTVTHGLTVGQKSSDSSYGKLAATTGRTFRWHCPLCDQTSFATFATPEEAAHYLVSHLDDDYCRPEVAS